MWVVRRDIFGFMYPRKPWKSIAVHPTMLFESAPEAKIPASFQYQPRKTILLTQPATYDTQPPKTYGKYCLYPPEAPTTLGPGPMSTKPG